jgi:hypothetical protein
MNICPCCKRKMPAPAAPKIDRRITQDLARANASILALMKAEANPFYADIRAAIQDEKIRLRRMLTDHRLMWNVFRRRDKGAPYYETARLTSRKVA